MYTRVNKWAILKIEQEERGKLDCERIQDGGFLPRKFFKNIAIIFIYYVHCNIYLTGVAGLPPISEHRDKLKIQGEATYFFNKRQGVLKLEQVLLMSV